MMIWSGLGPVLGEECQEAGTADTEAKMWASPHGQSTELSDCQSGEQAGARACRAYERPKAPDLILWAGSYELVISRGIMRSALFQWIPNSAPHPRTPGNLLFSPFSASL